MSSIRQGPIRCMLAAALLSAAASSPRAQTFETDPFEGLPDAADQAAQPWSPRMRFDLLAEIPLPGPLPGAGPRMKGDRVEIPVAGGSVTLRPEAGASADWSPTGPPAAPDDPWAVDDRGRSRYRVEGGFLLAQRRCKHCRKGWRKKWKLRVAGGTTAPPLVLGRRVYFGALDNRVYCVKSRNGHRVWAIDVGGRVSKPLVAWRGEAPGPRARDGSVPVRHLQAILAVPDGKAEVLALAADSGAELARLALASGEGKWVSVPLATDDGKVIVARQKYAESEASLMVYDLRPASPARGAAASSPPAAGKAPSGSPGISSASR